VAAVKGCELGLEVVAVPRLRTLKPEFFTHEVLGELSPLHRLLYQGLWCYADREGRLEEKARFLKTVILPYDDCDIPKMLLDLEANGFIVRYESDDKRLIAIPAFLEHQKPHPREAKSKLPPPKKTKALPRQDLGAALPPAEQDLGVVEPGGLGGLCLGDFGLGGRSTASAAPDGAQPAFELTAQSPEPPPRASSQQERFAKAAEEARRQHLEEMGLKCSADSIAGWKPPRLNKHLEFVTRETFQLVVHAYVLFLGDERKGRLKPPWPMWAFVQDWRDYEQAAQAQLAEGAA
jgi:hypothetical protein